MSILKNLAAIDRYVPPAPWVTPLLSSGLERWEAFRLFGINHEEAVRLRREALRERNFADTKQDKAKWQRNIKRAIRCERQARIRDERAEQWRRIAKQIPYPLP